MYSSQQSYTIPPSYTNTPHTMPPGYTLPPQVADAINATTISPGVIVGGVAGLLAFFTMVMCICHCLTCGNVYVTRTFPKPRRNSAMSSKPG